MSGCTCGYCNAPLGGGPGRRPSCARRRGETLALREGDVAAGARAARRSGHRRLAVVLRSARLEWRPSKSPLYSRPASHFASAPWSATDTAGRRCWHQVIVAADCCVCEPAPGRASDSPATRGRLSRRAAVRAAQRPEG